MGVLTARLLVTTHSLTWVLWASSKCGILSLGIDGGDPNIVCSVGKRGKSTQLSRDPGFLVSPGQPHRGNRIVCYTWVTNMYYAWVSWGEGAQGSFRRSGEPREPGDCLYLFCVHVPEPGGKGDHRRESSCECICRLHAGVWVVGKGFCLLVLKEGFLEEEV